MRNQLKDSWLIIHKDNDKRLYRKYRTYYNKIANINKLFYHHRICNIPMHEETKKLCISKVADYCHQMDRLLLLMVKGEITEKFMNYHGVSSHVPLGTWENCMYISWYISSLKDLAKRRADYQERKETLEKIKSGKTDNSIFNKIKTLFNKK